MDTWQYLKECGKPIVMYGMGNGADKITAELERRGMTVADYFASDGFVRGQTFRGKTVLSFSSVLEKYPSFAVVLAFGSSKDDVLSYFARLDMTQDLLIPDVPVAGGEIFDDAFCAHHHEELQEASRVFSDERSKEVFAEICEAKRTGRLSLLFQSADCRWFDPNSPISGMHFSSFADFGAYRGDTVAAALKAFPSIHTVTAVEPEPKTAEKLRQYCKTQDRITCRVIEAAVGARCEIRHLSGDDNRGASLSHNGEKIVQCETADRLLSETPTDLIKYDVEGAEAEALSGSLGIIARDRPTLIVSAYHKSEDLYRLPLMLCRSLTDYLYFLRRARSVPAWDVEIYAVPREKYQKGERI